MVHFWDLDAKIWKLIHFRSPKQHKNEEEDEAGETEDLLSPWDLQD